jgi:hypothetical protein
MTVLIFRDDSLDFEMTVLMVTLHIRRRERSAHPFIDGMRGSAVDTLRLSELSPAMWANGSSLERVEGLTTLAAFPVLARRWRCLAGRAGKSIAARELGEA